MWGQATIAPTKDNVPSSPLIGNRLDGLRQKVDAFLNESMTLAWQEWHRAAVAAAATATAAYADATDPIKNRVADWVASAGGCLDGHADETQLINHLKCLAWYSAGGVDMDNPPVMDSNQIGHFIITNNALLNELGLCQTLTTLLKRYAVKKEEEEEKEEHTEAQISDCLTITYLLLICNEHWTDADVHFDIDLLSILIRLLTKQYLSTELARKLFLTLHAGLLTILGDADDAAQTQAHLEKAHNLPGQGNLWHALSFYVCILEYFFIRPSSVLLRQGPL
ncbi:hypothetical protein BCR43DRAFT_68567 [Syncephalastrum racemosum]|uniref:Far11/STRP N-terminal domain-containing protein n=1 Tax=Syncephalastrum racemosum TaxID=13706 RepID=A0A1X2HWI1_SYNRA|nr:hypothetical protein BCR43DRAFT_68567 [Syncephalastrum racemosum]